MGVPLPRLPFAAPVGMVNRVHGDPPVVGPPSEPAAPPGLPDGNVLMIGIANLSHGGHAFNVDGPHFSRGKPDMGIVALLCHDLRAVARAPDKLPSPSGGQFDVVDHRP